MEPVKYTIWLTKMNEDNLLTIAFAVTPVVLLAFSVIAFIVIALTLDRRLKKEFDQHPNIIQQPSWIFRVACIGLNVVFKNRSSKDRIMSYHYQGFDFRSFAKGYEIIFCFLYVYCTIFMGVVALLAYPAEYLGIIHFGLLE